MALKTYRCPNCGAPLVIAHSFVLTVGCEYCGQMSVVVNEGLDPTGQKGALADNPSQLTVGARGKIDDRAFTALGRVRMKYADGFWDEWFLLFDDGERAWLQEDEGSFVIFHKERINAEIVPFNKVKVGTTLECQGTELFITEKQRAVVAGGEGELPFAVYPGAPADYVEGNAGGSIMSIEYLHDELSLSRGKEIQRHSLKLLEPGA